MISNCVVSSFLLCECPWPAGLDLMHSKFTINFFFSDKIMLYTFQGVFFSSASQKPAFVGFLFSSLFIIIWEYLHCFLSLEPTVFASFHQSAEMFSRVSALLSIFLIRGYEFCSSSFALLGQRLLVVKLHNVILIRVPHSTIYQLRNHSLDC